MESRENNRSEEKRKLVFAMPRGMVMHQFWTDSRLMLCTEHLKHELVGPKNRRMDDEALEGHTCHATREESKRYT